MRKMRIVPTVEVATKHDLDQLVRYVGGWTNLCKKEFVLIGVGMMIGAVTDYAYQKLTNKEIADLRKRVRALEEKETEDYIKE